MPSLSPTMTHGTISAWKKQPGDQLKAGDILCEIETDKASVGFEIQDDAVLAKIIVDAHGPELKCGEPIAVTVEDLSAYQLFLSNPGAVVIPVSSSSSATAAIPATTSTSNIITSSTTTKTTSSPLASSIRLSPAARHMVESQNLSGLSSLVVIFFNTNNNNNKYSNNNNNI